VKGIAFATLDEATVVAGYAAPTCSLIEGSASSSLVCFDGFGLWALRARLGPGSTLAWSAPHGDEAVYVAEWLCRDETYSLSRPVKNNVIRQVSQLESTNMRVSRPGSTAA